jgi:hypothetical protein
MVFLLAGPFNPSVGEMLGVYGIKSAVFGSNHVSRGREAQNFEDKRTASVDESVLSLAVKVASRSSFDLGRKRNVIFSRSRNVCTLEDCRIKAQLLRFSRLEAFEAIQLVRSITM